MKKRILMWLANPINTPLIGFAISIIVLFAILLIFAPASIKNIAVTIMAVVLLNYVLYLTGSLVAKIAKKMLEKKC